MKNPIRVLFLQKAGSIIVVTVVIYIASVLFVPRFGTLLNLKILLKSTPQLGIVSLGVCLLMISGEFDLSVGSNFALSSLIVALLATNGTNIWLSFLLSLIVGILIGSINGLITIKTGIPSFITTLATMMVWRGVVLLISKGRPYMFHPPSPFYEIFAGSFGFIPVQFIWFIGFTVLFWLLLENHKFGNRVFATGGNKNVAIAVGVNAYRVKLICFIIAGAMAALAGSMEATRVSSVSPAQGEGMELEAIAASVIGGTSLMGGEGTILGTFLGAMIIYTIQDILLLARAPGFYFRLFIGIFILLAVMLNIVIKKDNTRRY